MNPVTRSICTLAVISCSSLFASAGSEGGLLDLAQAIRADASMRETLFSPFPESLKASIQLQMRYSFNQRGSESTTLTNPDDDLTIGFTNRRTKLGLSGKITDDISAKLKFAFSQSTGSASLEDAVLKWKLSDTVTFRAGQFKPSLLREENMSSSKQLATDRSSVNETFNQDFTQGVEFIFTEDDWRLIGSFNDGIGADNTFITSSKEADFGITARGELKVGDASWKQYKQFTSWRGSNGGLMLGGAFHHQSMGNTNPATIPSTEMNTGTVDASLLGDGWNLYAAGILRTMDVGALSLTDAGFILQGGVFVSESDEFFARWDVIIPSDDSPVVVGTSGNSDFNTFTVGWNHYLIPESHAAKFTLELQRYPDATTESIVAVKGNLLKDSTGDQFAITAQFQLLF